MNLSSLRIGLVVTATGSMLVACGEPMDAAVDEVSQALTVYQVGPGKPYATLQAVAALVRPGDVVEVAGGVTYTGGVRFTQSGTASNKIRIVGVPSGGKRPVLSGGTNTVEFAADHYVFENFDVTGGSSRCVFHHGHDITIRNTVIHDCPSHGILGADSDAGSLTLEYSEIYRAGQGDRRHPIYMSTDQSAHPGSVFRMQYCYIHDGNGGNNVKSRAERNEIYFNWIEGAYYHELELIGPDGQESSRREDSDVVGNVFFQGYTTRSHPAIRIGGDGTGETFGRYRFVNNTIVMGNASTSPAFRVFDGIESVEMHNNVLYRQGGGAVQVLNDGEANWASGRVIGGTRNWVTAGSSGIPSTWSGTITGSNPGFADLTGRNLRPSSSSALRDAGGSSFVSPSGHPFPSPLASATFEPPARRLLAAGTAVRRVPVGATDIGAFELGNTGTSTVPPPPPTVPPPPPSVPPPPPPSGTTSVLVPIEDAYVRGGTYATQNFGTATSLHVKTDASADLTRDAYLKFALGTISTVKSAFLRVYANLSLSDNVTTVLYPVSGSWSESALTWNTRPGYLGSQPLGSMTLTSTALGWREFDVTSWVKSELQAGRRLVSFAFHCPTASDERVNINSSEASSNRPELVVTF